MRGLPSTCRHVDILSKNFKLSRNPPSRTPRFYFGGSVIAYCTAKRRVNAVEGHLILFVRHLLVFYAWIQWILPATYSAYQARATALYHDPAE